MKKIYTAICFLTVGLCATAQMPPIKWQKSFQTDTGRAVYEPSGAFDQLLPPNTDLVDIKPIAAGGYMAIVRGRQPLLVKINSTGDTLFTKKLTDGCTRLQVLADGSAVVMSGNGASHNGLYGIVLCKYSSDGALLWKEEYKGGPSLSLTYKQEYPVDFVVTPDDGFLILAHSNALKGNDKSEDPIGPVAVDLAADYWVIKTNADGLPEWDRTIGGSAVEMAASVINTADGGYIIAGTSNSPVSGNKTAPQKGIDHQNPPDVWLVKIDDLGNVVWDKTVGTAIQEYSPLAIATKDGGFLLACNTAAGISGDKTEASFGGNDTWVMKMNDAGNIQWQKTLGGIYSEEPSSLLELPGGGYLITQASNSPIGGNKTIDGFTPFGADIWQVKLSATGAVEWQEVFGGLETERYPIAILNSDGSMLLASSTNSDVGGNKTVPTKSKFMFEGAEYTGGNDVWLMLFDVPTLPVSLLSFTGNGRGADALLQWKTASEENFSHFELEKSFDGQAFSTTAKVLAKGNGSQYNYTDINVAAPAGGFVYYRLKMVDKDGVVKYSNIVVINTGRYASAAMAPNPVSGNQQLTMTMAAAPKNAAWQIVGVDGKIYASQKIAAGTTQVKIETTALAKGVYMLVYGHSTDRKVMRFVKN